MADGFDGDTGGAGGPTGGAGTKGGKPLTGKGTATAGAIPPEHRANLMLGAAIVGVIGFGLYARKKASGGGAQTAGASPGATANVQPGYGTLSGAAYDSTATDLYNSIEPQLENLQGQLTKVTGPQGQIIDSLASLHAGQTQLANLGYASWVESEQISSAVHAKDKAVKPTSASEKAGTSGPLKIKKG